MTLVEDLRAAGRQFIAQPGWAAAAIVCLAIASGANAAAFSLLEGLLLRPLPFERPEQLAMIALRDPLKATVRPFSLREYRALADDADGVGCLLARTYFPASLASADGAQMAQIELVSANYFDTLRVTPLGGRFFEAADDRIAGVVPAVISHALWQRRFGGDRAIVGRGMRVNGRPVVIVGIAPPAFVGAMQLVAADLWLPAAIYPELARSSDAAAVPAFGVMARLAENITAAQAATRLTSAVSGDRTTWSESPPAVVVTPAAGFGVPVAIEGAVFGITTIVYAVMALLTVVACANVAALVLARGAGRTREIAIRLGLGASRAYIARQLLVESLAIAVAGCAAGTIVGLWLIEAVVAQMSTPFQYVSYAVDVRPDARVFVCCAAATGFAALLCGIAPIRHAARVDVIELLRDSSAGPSPRSKRLFNVGVAVQFAVSTLLLVAAACLARTYLAAQSLRPAFETDRLVAMTLDADQIGLDRAGAVRFFGNVVARLSGVPGIAHIAIVRNLPFGPAPAVTVGADANALEPFVSTEMVVSSTYFDTIGLALRDGRPFREVEPASTPVAIVDDAAARRIARGGSAVGLRYRPVDASAEPIEIIGVVSDAMARSDGGNRRPTVYRPFPQAYSARMTILMRSHGDPGSILDEARRAIRDVNSDVAVVDLRTVNELLERSNAERRVPATVLAVVGALALLLSAVGLYGVIAYAVRDRLKEIGIRLALGAQRANVRWLVLRQGLTVVVTGLAVGAIAATAAITVVRRTFFGVTAVAAVDIAAVGAVLVAAAVAALYWPARWASRVEPAETLRR